MRPPTPDYTTNDQPTKKDKSKDPAAAKRKQQLKGEISQLVVGKLSKFHKSGQIDKVCTVGTSAALN